MEPRKFFVLLDSALLVSLFYGATVQNKVFPLLTTIYTRAKSL